MRGKPCRKPCSEAGWSTCIAQSTSIVASFEGDQKLERWGELVAVRGSVRPMPKWSCGHRPWSSRGWTAATGHERGDAATGRGRGDVTGGVSSHARGGSATGHGRGDAATRHGDLRLTGARFGHSPPLERCCGHRPRCFGLRPRRSTGSRLVVHA